MKTNSKYIPEDILIAENEVMYEQYCNSVGARLRDLDNPGDIDCKRWPWELIQNANDTVVKRKEDKFVDVVFHRYIDKKGHQCLSFSHNGEPFSAKALVGLKWKFSAEKRSEEITEDGIRRDKQSTGRFGTGFLTTHALSRIIDIKGALETKDNGQVSVDMTLYRNGVTDDELKDGLLRTDNEAQYGRREVELIDGHPTTEFIYHLDSEDKVRPARMGIANLMDNSAQTMTFCPSVRSITIEDEVDNIFYRICRKGNIKRLQENLIQCKFEEVKDNETRNRIFIVNSIEEPNPELSLFKGCERNVRLQLAIEVDDKKGVQPILYKDSPSVYCSLPLIGFERMTLPFYINSNDFEPVTERTALLLKKIRKGKSYNNEKNREEEVIYPNGINWMILERSIPMYQELIDYLIENDYTDLYNLGNGLGQILDRSSNWTEEEKDCLAARYIIPLREAMIRKSIVMTNDGLKSVKEDNLHFPKSAKPDFYEICNNIYGNSMPVFDELKYWIENKWGAYKFTDGFEEVIDRSAQSIIPLVDTNAVANFIEEAGDINSLNLIDQSNPIEWLNSFYMWLSDTKSSIINEKKIVPNRKKNFVCISGEKPLKNGSDIDEDIYTFMKQLELNWDEQLLLDGIDNITLETIKRDDVANAIQKRCREIIDDESNVMKQLLPIITAIPTNAENENRKKFRNKRIQIIEFFKAIYQVGVTDETEIDLPSAIWEDTDYWLTGQFLDKVASREQLDVINDNGDNPANRYCTIEWLNKFVNFLIDNGYLHQEELSGDNDDKHWILIPNEYGEFCSLDQLYTIGNVPPELLDESFAESGIDIKATLVHNQFEINKKLNVVSLKLANIVKDLETFYHDKGESQGTKIEVASYIIHLKPSRGNMFENIVNVYDAFTHYSGLQNDIECSDISLWKESVNVIVNYLADEISDAGSLDMLDKKLQNEDGSAPTISAINWLEDYIDCISGAKIPIPEETLIRPDYYGNLHSIEDKMYDGSCIESIEDLIPILESGLLNDCPFEEEDADFKRNILDYVLMPGFKHTKGAQNDTKSMILGIINECVTYCYNNLTSRNRELVKDAVERIVNYFQVEANAKDEKFMPELYSTRNDMAMALLYDPETRKQLQKMHDTFTSDEIQQLLDDKTIIQQLSQKRDELYNEIKQLETLKLIQEEFPGFDLSEILDRLQKEQGDFDPSQLYDRTTDLRKIQIGDEGECFIYKELCGKYGTENVRWSNLVTPSTPNSRCIRWDGDTYYLCT
ncbi:MAG: hypothetical protein IAC51_03880, partial [bacterium]|nr:hypothetical protein [Candidatus Aphodosoma intestinipullorum]